MKQERSSNAIKNWRQPKVVFLIFLVFILVLIGQFAYLSLSNKIYGLDLKSFAEKRITVAKELIAKRGTIFDSEGNVLAINVTSYTLIAYLDSSRTLDPSNPQHVINKEETAKKLSEALKAPYDYVYERLVKEGIYQVEFGSYGAKLTELAKLHIEELEIPGIDFVESSKRFYPNGPFASYIIGYAKIDMNGNISGELGIESKYNDILKGINGSLLYQKDPAGYQIPDTPETRKEAIDGSDIYLTIDSNIQRFLETAVKDTVAQYDPEWMIMVVMDAKTGEILGSATSPSFDVNNLPADMSYQNPLISYAYEPGSVMKTYTYMCAINSGLYDGDKTYSSGSYKIGPNTINDWRKNGWGKISYDKGFMYSSNVGSIHVAKDYLSPEKLRDCLESYGFGSLTGIELSNEVKGSIAFNGNIEIDWLSVSFGQGLSTTAIQLLQALSIIANDGYMVEPHLIKKVVDNNTGKETITPVKRSDQIVSKETADKMKELMYGAINNSWAPGYTYHVDGFDLIGKTGTAQIYENGRYLAGDGNYLISFAGIYPMDNPEIILYTAMKKPETYYSRTLAPAVKDVVKNIAKYKNINTNQPEETNVFTYSLSSYLNQNINDVEKSLKGQGLDVIVIGNGDVIVNQYPYNGSTVVTKDKIFLITNGIQLELENVVGWSRTDFERYMNLIGLSYKTNGYGFIKKQSIKAGTLITKDLTLEVDLENKYNIDGKKELEEE
jgi:Cell division protein FtsI/penicillin-binding protein 2